MAEGSIAADELRLLIERIERLEEEKKAIADDVKDVYGEAKSAATTPRPCAPSSASGRWKPTTARKPTPCSKPTRLRSASTESKPPARPGPLHNSARANFADGRPQQVQEHHVSQGRAGQEALCHVLEARPRDHGGGQNGPARSER